MSGVAKGKSLDLKVMREHKTLSLTAKLTTDPIGLLNFDWIHDMFRRFEQQPPRTSSSRT